jgi:hypothetical protein
MQLREYPLDHIFPGGGQNWEIPKKVKKCQKRGTPAHLKVHLNTFFDIFDIF